MTDNDDNTNTEHVIPTNPVVHQETMDDDGDDDFADAGSNEQESGEGELTPNDIFGLDPLDVLTLEELAEYLKVSPAAAKRVVKEQHLPSRTIGGELRFLRDAVANWLRCQEAPAQAQQKAREDYSKPKVTPPPATPPQSSEAESYSRPPRRPYQPEQSGGGQSGGGEYRPRQRFPEGGQQYGNQGGGGGGQYGNRGGQYGGGQSGGGGQYGSGQSGSSQYGGGQSGGGQSGGQYGGGSQYTSGNSGGGEGGSSYSRPPRRPFRAAEGGGGGNSGGGAEGGGTSGYGGGGGGGTQFGGGGYAGGGQRFGGGPKRKNKRQVFDNERGKRLDRRKEDGTPEASE